MRLFLVLFLALLAVGEQSPPTVERHKPEQVSSGKEEHAARDQTPNNPPATISNADAITNQNRAHKGSSDSGNSAPANNLITWFTGVLAIVAVLQLGILGLQFWAAHRQAEYLRSAERAHVDIDFVGDKHIYTIMFANYGKSIATIVEYSFMHASYPLEMTEFSAESASASFEDTIPMNYILPTGQPKEFTSFDLRTFLPKQALEGIHQVIIRGLVVYNDIFGEEHETEVAYRYRSFDLKLKNLPEYNRYT